MIWGVVTHFNAGKFKRNLENLRKFAYSVRRQGLPILIMEVAFGSEPFVIPNGLSDQLIQLRSDSILWHKERLFNMSLSHLHANCDAVCWLDADILFTNDNWVSETQQMLKVHSIVQPFEFCIWLPPETNQIGFNDSFYPTLNKEAGRLHSFGFGWKNGGSGVLEDPIQHGHAGFAWAARREVIEGIGFYDSAVIGSGDALMAHAFVDKKIPIKRARSNYSEKFVEHYSRWAKKTYEKVAGDIGYTRGTVYHLWHGLSVHRNYGERLQKLKDYDYDPVNDIKTANNGLYEWTDDTSELAKYCSGYFKNRREDDEASYLRNFIFREGFYEDEGGYRWSAAESTLRVIRDVGNLRFAVTNCVLHNFHLAQNIDIQKNTRSVYRLSISGNSVEHVELKNLKIGDEIQFYSDFEFVPAQFGQDDKRNLSFMIIHMEAE